MPTQALAQFDPKQFFHSPAATGTSTHRLDTKVSAVAISNDLEGRLSVTTAEGDKITLTADLQYDYRAVNYTSKVQTDNGTVDVKAKYLEASLKREVGVAVDGDLNEQELKDLEKLFRNVSNIFRKFFSGQDEAALAKTARLAERFGNLSSLSSLDLSVDVQRSVTVLAAQIAAEVTGQPAVPRPQESQTSTAPSSTGTQGGAPAAAAAIPQPPTGTTAPTFPSSAAPVQNPADGIRLSAPIQEAQEPASLVQQVFDSLKNAHVETRKVLKHLPSFLQQLREDLVKELRQRQEVKEQGVEPPVNQVPLSTNSSLLVAYQAVRYTSISLSLHS
ncbi:MAG: hypothetical protein HP492_15605 [Nitrospira sp.]|nr:hypothetical protein [Nitrospira sp.]